MLWFIRLLENSSIYQLWGHTDCLGTDQAASSARKPSKRWDEGERKKRREKATGGKQGCREPIDVVLLFSSWARPWVLQLSRWCACGPLPSDFSIPVFGAHTVFPWICICFSVVSKYFLSVYALCTLCLRVWHHAKPQEEYIDSKRGTSACPLWAVAYSKVSLRNK